MVEYWWIPLCGFNFSMASRGPQVEYLKQGIQEDHPLYLCPIIIQEILQGIRSDQDYENVKDSILAFSYPGLGPYRSVDCNSTVVSKP